VTRGPVGWCRTRRGGSAPQVVRTLPLQQQEIITLRVAVGMSTEETRAALGMRPERSGSPSTGP